MKLTKQRQPPTAATSAGRMAITKANAPIHKSVGNVERTIIAPKSAQQSMETSKTTHAFDVKRLATMDPDTPPGIPHANLTINVR